MWIFSGSHSYRTLKYISLLFKCLKVTFRYGDTSLVHFAVYKAFLQASLSNLSRRQVMDFSTPHCDTHTYIHISLIQTYLLCPVFLNLLLFPFSNINILPGCHTCVDICEKIQARRELLSFSWNRVLSWGDSLTDKPLALCQFGLHTDYLCSTVATPPALKISIFTFFSTSLSKTFTAYVFPQWVVDSSVLLRAN